MTLDERLEELFAAGYRDRRANTYDAERKIGIICVNGETGDAVMVRADIGKAPLIE